MDEPIDKPTDEPTDEPTDKAILGVGYQAVQKEKERNFSAFSINNQLPSTKEKFRNNCSQKKRNWKNRYHHLAR